MEDVNPLIERYKPSLQGHSIFQWRQKTIVACSKYKHQIFLGSSVLLLIICVAIVFSIIFAGELVCPSDEWRSFEGHCYRLLTDYHSMEECREDCNYDHGGDIASVHSLAENDFITTFVQERPVRGGERDTWIGGYIEETDGQFSWLDGSSWNFQNWDVGEPDRKSLGREHHECVFLGKNQNNLGKWWDGVCSWNKWSFDCICKL